MEMLKEKALPYAIVDQTPEEIIALEQAPIAFAIERSTGEIDVTFYPRWESAEEITPDEGTN